MHGWLVSSLNQYSLFPGLIQVKTVLASWILIVLIQTTFMQSSMSTLNSPSSRVVKDSTPSRHQILRCINFGIGESSPNLVLNKLNFYLVKFEARWILNERALKCLIHFVYLKVNLDPEKKNKTNQLGKSSSNFIFAAVNLDSIV